MRRSVTALFLICAASAALAADCPVKWTYQQQELWPGFCQSGPRQSPVDLFTERPAPLQKLELHYGRLTIRVKNTSRTAKINFVCCDAYITLDGVRYNLEELHFHVPAEHPIRGVRDLMEMHIVHKTADKKRAVAIGVLFEAGTSSETLSRIINATPAKVCAYGGSGDFDPIGTILPWRERGPNPWWTYDGSLTTPNCDPVVKFIILKTKLGVSEADRKLLLKLFGETARDVKAPLPVMQKP